MAADLSKTTLAKGLRILEIIAENNSRQGVGLARIVEASRMNRSNVYRYLKTLVDCGWVDYDFDTYRYRIGGKSLQIVGASLQQMDLRTIARPFLEDLAQETCLAAHLGLLHGSTVIYIEKVDSNSPILMRSRVGMVVPAYCTAMGKALLAMLNPQEIAELLGDNLIRRTPYTITRIEDLLADLDAVRLRGYAVDQEENELGIGCIGAAIYGYDNEVVGAISLSTLITDLPPEKISQFGMLVSQTAIKISRQMGCLKNDWLANQEFFSEPV